MASFAIVTQLFILNSVLYKIASNVCKCHKRLFYDYNSSSIFQTVITFSLIIIVFLPKKMTTKCFNVSLQGCTLLFRQIHLTESFYKLILHYYFVLK